MNSPGRTPSPFDLDPGLKHQSACLWYWSPARAIESQPKSHRV